MRRNQDSRSGLERPIKEGDNPVRDILMNSTSILSTAGHEESRRNPPGPSGKAKYYLVTDSEPVPGGKGEKNPGRGVKEYLKPCAYK